jgi:guanyl-specific ribonuclease Sa
MVALVAVFAQLFGTSPTSATTESLGSVSAYTYDNLHLVVAPTHTTTERGPPASYDRETDYDTAGRSLDDASARTNGVKAWPTTTATTPALVVQKVRGNGTTEGRAQADAGLQPSPAPAGVAANGVGKIPLGPASDDAWRVLNRVDSKGAPLPGYKGGKVWDNNGTQGAQILPRGADGSVTYREWDLTQKVKGVDRDGRRLVTGSDGSAFYTTDHYLSFIQIR